MTNLRDELARILEQLEILSPASFRFRGEVVNVTPGVMTSVPGIPSHPLPEFPLTRDLQSALYTHCYSRRLDDPAPPPPTEFKADPAFLPQLVKSNRARTGWEGGWTIYQVSTNGQVWLMKGDRQRAAVPGEFIGNGPPGVPPQVGSIVSVQVLHESTVAQQGFYYLYGETLGDVWDDHNMVRFYFNAPATVAPELIEQLSSRLNRYQVPYRMKALNEPAFYGRTDSIVLYIARRHYTIVLNLVRDLPRTLTSQLNPSTPLFTEPVQPGIGTAEDPSTGESFGMHRCRLAAEGIVEAWRRGDQSVEGRLRAIESTFARNGFSLSAPHLCPGSRSFANVPTEVEFAYA